VSKAVKKLEVKNKLGLHARAAAQIVQAVNKFTAQVTLSKDGQPADGRSIMGVLALAATQGTKIVVEANGEDADRAVKAVEKLFDGRFGESE